MDQKLANVTGRQQTNVVITTASGKRINLGRVDGLFPWRLWWYRYVTYPRLKREQERG